MTFSTMSVYSKVTFDLMRFLVFSQAVFWMDSAVNKTVNLLLSVVMHGMTFSTLSLCRAQGRQKYF